MTTSNCPLLKVGEILELLKLDPKQHFTQPPPRYTEATLIKELEKLGIGRPSTYATILTVILGRLYVAKIKAGFKPTELGMMINDLLVASFPNIMDVGFTANLEERLDTIAAQVPWSGRTCSGISMALLFWNFKRPRGPCRQ